MQEPKRVNDNNLFKDINRDLNTWKDIFRSGKNQHCKSSNYPLVNL